MSCEEHGGMCTAYGHEDRFADNAPTEAEWLAALSGPRELTLPPADADDVLWAVAAALSELHINEAGWCICTTHRTEAERLVDSLGYRGVEIRRTTFPRPVRRLR